MHSNLIKLQYVLYLCARFRFKLELCQPADLIVAENVQLMELRLNSLLQHLRKPRKFADNDPRTGVSTSARFFIITNRGHFSSLKAAHWLLKTHAEMAAGVGATCRCVGGAGRTGP